MSKCRACPVAGPCVAEKPGWGFACKLAGGTAAERAFVVNRSAIDAGTFVSPPSVHPPPEPEPDFSALRVGPARRPCCPGVDLSQPADAEKVTLRANPTPTPAVETENA